MNNRHTQVSTSCVLMDKGVEGDTCTNNIIRNSETDCRDVPIRVKWRYCNDEDWAIGADPQRSRIKLNGKTLFTVMVSMCE